MCKQAVFLEEHPQSKLLGFAKQKFDRGLLRGVAPENNSACRRSERAVSERKADCSHAFYSYLSTSKALTFVALLAGYTPVKKPRRIEKMNIPVINNGEK